jgi:flagellar protein FliS
LLAPLDLEAGGAIASNLRDLYQYMVYRLTMGNLHSDDAALAECAALARSLTDSWDAIGPQIDLPAQAAA